MSPELSITTEKPAANILLLGRTGAGKSSLINYLHGSELCRTGSGRPETQTFCTCEITAGHDVPLRLIDSKGLEVEAYREIRRQILNYLQSCSGSPDVREWIHAVFFVLNVRTARLLPAETELIRLLQQEITPSVHVILTHCGCDETGAPDAETIQMKRHVLEELADTEITVCCVNSVATESRRGSCPAFGREAVLAEAARLLWEDLSRKAAREYAAKLYAALMRSCHALCGAIEASIDEACRMPLAELMSGTESALEEKIQHIETECAEQVRLQMAQAEAWAASRLTGLRDFCSSFGFGMREPFPELMPQHIVNVHDLFMLDDALIRSTALGTFSADLGKSDPRDFWELSGAMFRGLGSLVMRKEMLRSAKRQLQRLLRRRLPDKQTLYTEILRRLNDGLLPEGKKHV